MQNSVFEKLQIKLLASSGELLNVINCHAGKVTVFRATSDRELESYKRALSGRPGPENFSIVLDQQPWQPEDHSLIGFGEQFVNGDLSVEEYLHSCQIDHSAIPSLALSFGLEDCLHHRCAELNSDLLRRLQLIEATRSSGKVVVLNAPFEPIVSEWREKFAELVCNFARQQRQLIVVTKLVYRPECWIDNDTIIRVQVGENIQKTIGFGQGSSSTNEMVKTIRELMKDQNSAEKLLQSMGITKTATTQESSTENLTAKQLETSSETIIPDISTQEDLEAFKPASIHGKAKKIGLYPYSRWAAPIVLILLTVMFLRQFSDKGFEPVAIQSKVENVDVTSLGDNQEPLATEKDRAQEEQPAASMEAAVAPINQPIELPSSRNGSIAARYSNDINLAIVNAFAGKYDPDATSVFKQESLPLVNSSGSNKQAALSQTNLFTLLQAASNTGGKDTSSSFPQEIAPIAAPVTEQQLFHDDSDAEAKRQIVHQRFLEAIRRASERRAQEENF